MHRNGEIQVDSIADVEYVLSEEREIHFSRATIFGKPALITDMETYTVPTMPELESMNRYEIKSAHDNPNQAVSLERYVPLDHYATVYSLEPLIPHDCKYSPLTNSDIVLVEGHENCSPTDFIAEQKAGCSALNSSGQEFVPIPDDIPEQRKKSVRAKLKEKRIQIDKAEVGKLESQLSNAFEYGGYHFVPERNLAADENDFYRITRCLKTDVELGMFDKTHPGNAKKDYSHKAFYEASNDKTADLFRCVENGKLYLPCEHELAEYREVMQQARNLGCGR